VVLSAAGAAWSRLLGSRRSAPQAASSLARVPFGSAIPPVNRRPRAFLGFRPEAPPPTLIVVLLVAAHADPESTTKGVRPV